ncbi:MAG: rhomboid family intramembrane serine protease [Bacteroidetes bacterium]|nr:rhomboid family intramembrane serine protease [Bacteroidota bacterium]MDA0980532.1 rhomboid family intramembrane serine protease [Bacteroidota bacterium]
MWEDIKKSWTAGGMLYKLIWVNVGVFVLLNLAFGFTKLTGIQLSENVSGGFSLFATTDLPTLLYRPWSILTHMFAHKEIFHLLFNMMLLWWMGRMYVSVVGSRRLLSTYIMGGLAGFIIYALSVNILPGLSMEEVSFAYGASAAIMAIFTATATLNPTKRIPFFLFGSVELKYIAIGYVLFDYFGIMGDSGHETGGRIAHLGGAAFGYFLIVYSRKGINIVRWLEVIIDMIMSSIPTSSSNSFSKRFSFTKSIRKKPKVTRPPKSDDDFNSERKDREDRLDLILEKISRHGYDHLSKEEKKFLFTQSKK